MEKVTFTPARLALRTTQRGEPCTERVRVQGLTGSEVIHFRVASHPNDPPHQKGRHPWITVQFLQPNDLHIEVDTTGLQAGATYHREITLQVDEVESQLLLTIETAPLALPAQLPYLLLAPLLLAWSVVWSVADTGIYAPFNVLGVLLLGAAVGLRTAPTPGFVAGDMKLVWSFQLLSFLQGARTAGLVGAIGSMATGLWSDFRFAASFATPGPELLPTGGILGVVAGAAVSLMAFGRQWPKVLLGAGLGLLLGVGFAYWGGVGVLAGEFFRLWWVPFWAISLGESRVSSKLPYGRGDFPLLSRGLRSLA
jgi:hypothetical protein